MWILAALKIRGALQGKVYLSRAVGKDRPTADLIKLVL